MRTLVLLLVAGAALVAAAPGVASPTVTPQCTPAPADCSGWFRSDVTLSWVVAPDTAARTGCEDETFASDTAGAVRSCAAEDETGTQTSQVTIQRDATPPDVAAAMPDRPPDHLGWFTAPVTFSILGADATSGIAACDPVSYAGPDSPAASVTGTCRDIAGNVSSRAFGLMFDATAPPISALRAIAGDRRVTVSWSTAPDVTQVEVLRIPGVGTQPASVVFAGPGSRFGDDDVENRVSYVYRVRLADAAGNESNASVAATPTLPLADLAPGASGLPPAIAEVSRPRSARLRRPRANAVVRTTRPPLLRWTRIKRARYYNVQLYRGTRKVLSAWPTRPRYQLKRRWSFAGKARRLRPGRYLWYVWPGYGARANGRYGDLLGRRGFRVVR